MNAFRPTQLIGILGCVALSILPTTRTRCLADNVEKAGGWLHLSGNDFLSGTIVETDDSESDPHTRTKLGWRNDLFSQPLQFELSRLRSLSFENRPVPKSVKGSFLLTTKRGDHVVGKIVDRVDEQLVIRTQTLGRMTIPISAVRHLVRLSDDVPPPIAGPISIDQWTNSGNRLDWESHGGQFLTRAKNAALSRDHLLSNRCEIEFQVSWKDSPNFAIAIGTKGVNGTEADKAFRIEVWDQQIVLLRELEERADVVSLGKLKSFKNSLRAKLKFDAIKQSVELTIVPDNMGTATESPVPQTYHLQVTAKQQSLLGRGLHFSNLRGTFQVDSFQITPLPEQISTEHPGDPAGPNDTPSDTFILSDGRDVHGRLSSIQSGKWIVWETETEYQIDPDDLVACYFRSQDSDPATQAEPTQPKPTEPSDPPHIVRLITTNGSSLIGQWNGVRDGQVQLRWTPSGDTTPSGKTGSDKTLGISLDVIRRIDVPGTVDAPKKETDRQYGRLQFAKGSMTAAFIESDSGKPSTPLRVSFPQGDPATLGTDFSGQLTYRIPPPAIKPTPPSQQANAVPARRVRPNNFGAAFLNGLARAFGNTAENQPSQPRSMHLRTGEIIPCDVQFIDDSGITFTSSVTDQNKIPHHQVRAIRLKPGNKEPDLTELERERLMTVPRVGRKRPPTHLLIANNGDVLRCRLTRMDEASAQVELRLETIEIERTLISQIIWLDQETESNEESVSRATASPTPKTTPTVRAIMTGGNQLSTVPQSVSNSEITGKHPFLGDTVIQLAQADVLIIGAYASPYDAEKPFQKWRLTDAPEPIIPETGGASGGIESPLVGKPAPDFNLDLYTGGRFRLSKNKGKVIVLDFWASWCGPCMSAMPVIEETIDEFDPNDVMLIAVNLQETKKEVETTFDRLGISPTVAMDIDGAAAAHYQANAIPQTVVIDRKGNIARVFVGAGGNLKTNLKSAIETLLTSEPENENSEASEQKLQ